MFLKIMGLEDAPDHSSNKTHELIEVSSYTVNRGGNGEDKDQTGEVFISFGHEGQLNTRRVYSNIYVMNTDGKTINTISPTPQSPWQGSQGLQGK